MHFASIGPVATKNSEISLTDTVERAQDFLLRAVLKVVKICIPRAESPSDAITEYTNLIHMFCLIFVMRNLSQNETDFST
jgi:hypothetical protein